MLFYYENSKQMRTSTLIIHQILTLKVLWIWLEMYCKFSYSFLVIDATLSPDNPLRFRKNVVERI